MRVSEIRMSEMDDAPRDSTSFMNAAYVISTGFGTAAARRIPEAIMMANTRMKGIKGRRRNKMARALRVAGPARFCTCRTNFCSRVGDGGFFTVTLTSLLLLLLLLLPSLLAAALSSGKGMRGFAKVRSGAAPTVCNVADAGDVAIKPVAGWANIMAIRTRRDRIAIELGKRKRGDQDLTAAQCDR